MTESATKLEELVGEGRKFATPEALAIGKIEADRFIETLQAETAELRVQLATLITKADSTETLEKLMTELANKNNNVPPVDKPVIPPTDPVNQTKALTQDDIVKLIEAREAEKVQNSNLAKAMAEAGKVYGATLVDGLAAKATELGMEFSELESLAKRSPQAFYNLIGLHAQSVTTRPMARGGQSPQQVAAIPGGGVRNKAYYENLRQTMGTMKFVMDRDLQTQMHKDLRSTSWE
jgi:hypothetical protein